MIRSIVISFIAISAIFCVGASGQSSTKNAHMGYVYPAGGQTGTTVKVMVGGQSLRGVKEAHITGDGIRIVTIRYLGRVPRLNRGERIELRRRLEEIRSGDPLPDYASIDLQREAPEANEASTEMEEAMIRSDPDPENKTTQRPDVAKGEDAKASLRERLKNKLEQKRGDISEEADGRTPLPRNALLRNIEELTPWEIEYIETEFFRFKDEKQVRNDQIAERVMIEVRIDADAAPGDRELRLRTPQGLTNPLCFQVGIVPEIREQEAPPPRRGSKTRAETVTGPVELPALLNGQVFPGDVDRFSFKAEKGQDLVIHAGARHLIPFLADAVPGWFQATLALFDSEGQEIAFADDFRFDPDPVLAFAIPKTGIYQLEVRDSIFRGREDFVYRIILGELPFVKSCFPLGGRMREETRVELYGWNLTEESHSLDTSPGESGVRRTAIEPEMGISNYLTYAVDRLPESVEAEPNDGAENAQKIDFPRIVNGRIGCAGDDDRFLFKGKAGSEIVIEVHARRLRSPLDSFVRLLDPKGNVVADNDDYQHKQGFLHRDMGIITHHADSYLQAKLPKSGLYCVQILDSQQHGGDDYGYRLRISRPRPDFAVHVTPSSVAMKAGMTVPIVAHVLRRDSFDGPVTLKLKGAPAGFLLQGNVVPAGRDGIRMTLSAPREPLDELVSLELVGIAEINGKKIRHEAISSDEVMQAFLYRHLLPSQELVVAVESSRYNAKPPSIACDIPVRIRAQGGKAKVWFKIPWRRRLADQLDLELNAPPEGMRIEDVSLSRGELSFQLALDSETLPAGFTDNLIIEVFKKNDSRRQDQRTKNKNRKDRISLGVLPAIPIEVTAR